MKANRILALAPHTDDVELGCGGTIARLVEEGKEVFVAVFSTAQESVPAGAPATILKDEFFRAIPYLGVPAQNLHVFDYPVRRLNYHRQDVLEHLVKLRREIKPELVFLPSGQDLHQDHQVVHNEGLRAFKDISILGYELPWNHINFAAQAFFSLEPRHLEKKNEALKEYKTQLELGRVYFQPDFMRSLAQVRGAQIKVPLAEAFEVLRVCF